MAKRYYQGKFKPRHPEKYRGDASNIQYRSSWELKFMMWLDSHPHVLQYSSEELAISYISPIDNRWHRYFPDFLVKMRNSQGKTETLMVEVKPSKQCVPPEKKKKITKAYINEVTTWGVNSAKWHYAEEYCKDRGWKFVKMTEKELFGGKM